MLAPVFLLLPGATAQTLTVTITESYYSTPDCSGTAVGNTVFSSGECVQNKWIASAAGWYKNVISVGNHIRIKDVTSCSEGAEGKVTYESDSWGEVGGSSIGFGLAGFAVTPCEGSPTASYVNTDFTAGCSTRAYGLSVKYTYQCGFALPATDDAPCFAAESTTVCKIETAVINTTHALSQCYEDGSGSGEDARLVLMSTLGAGDVVLAADAAGRLSLQTVIVNQHRANPSASSLIEIRHEAGSVGLTPDHVLLVDGAFAPASTVTLGSTLSLADGSRSVVQRLAATHGSVINAVTASGTILVSGASGAPVVASTHPEWSAAFLMDGSAPLPLFYTLAAMFPQTAQAYYGAVLEPIFDLLGTHLKTLASASSALVLPFLVADAIAAVGFSVYACRGALLAVAAVAAVAVSRAKVTRKFY